MVKSKNIFILTFSALLILSCDYSDRAFYEKRAERAAYAKGDIVIGVVDTSAQANLFLQGIQLAIEEINEEGGVLGRKMRPIIYDDNGERAEGQEIARKLSGNPDVIAVVGHYYSSVAVPVSITYNKNGILFISPGATHPNLTRYGGEFTFRNIPDDEDVGYHLAEATARHGIKKVVIFYQRDSGGKRLAEIFHEEAHKRGVEILNTRSFFEDQENFRTVLSAIKKEYKFDAIFIAGRLPASAFLIKQARDMGITVPIISGDGLDSPALMMIAGRAANGTTVPTVFNPDLRQRLTQNFVKRFNSKYGVIPDTWAAQAYDAIQVLAGAIDESGSTVPIVVATTLRFLENWRGVTGTYSFTQTGDITEKPIFFKTVRNGTFEFLKPELDDKVSVLDFVEESTLRLPLEGAVTTIDPGLTQEAISIEITEQLFLGLTDFNHKTYEPIPELATDWTVSDEGKIYRFRMRQNVTWTDGKPVTAHDVVWAVRRNIRPETKCPYAYVLYILKNAELINNGELKDVSELGVRAVDDFIVEFTLEHPAAYFPAMVGLWVYRPLPGSVIEEHGEQWTKPGKIQTNGSYSLAAWEKGIVMILRKNPDYYEAKKVSIPEVRYYVLPESSMGMEMYKNGELDIMGSSYLRLPMMELPNIRANPVLHNEYSREPIFTTYAYGFNTKRPPVDDVRVRKAIVAAIDRELIIEMITKGDEDSAATFTRPPVFGSVDPVKDPGIGIKLNPDQARKWLADAGYPGGEGFPEISLLYNASETHRTIAQAIQASLKYHLNIDIRLEEKTWEGYVEAMKDSNTPHIFRFGWGADYPDANNFLNEQLHPFRSANYVGWENMEFAELMDKAEGYPDPKERRALYKRAEQILCEEEAALIPLYFEIAHCLVKPRVKGWYHMALGGQHIRDWYFGERR